MSKHNVKYPHKNQFKKIVVVALTTAFMFIIIVSVVVLSSPSKGQAQMVQQNSNSSGYSMRPGRPAITPKYISGNASNSDKTLSPNKVFSEQDARNFASFHKFVGEVDNHSNYTVTSVQFMNSKEAGKLLDTSIGVADADLVCVVEMKGSRTFILGPDNKNTPGTFATSYLVFDGQSGNLLVESLNR
ncbi:MAG: hypothetical protein H0V70_08705 [Ktedonobacteraceae bacterium]|nr:hypothetical protein [Ktedonobacteraceae bacterium]